MEVGIKTIATKDDIAKVKYDLSKEVRNFAKWMFFFSITQVVAFWHILEVCVKK